jgi:hypothetical protein
MAFTATLMLHATAQFILKKLHLYGAYSLLIKGPLREDGWYRSFAEVRSVDAEGNPLPFYPYPAIEFIKRRLKPEMRVFEWGSGASTLWWAARVKQVVAVEHHQGWYEMVSASAPSNAQVLHIPLETGGAYCQALLEQPHPFDIVAIDGRDRVNCARHCIAGLAPSGVIIWDNSDRDYYQEGYDFLREKGFRQIEFVGLPPIINERGQTTIFYRDNNCFGI